jgi:hypothetical protein
VKRLLYVASVTSLLFFSPFGDACAAGPYDGQWNGSATAASGQCKPAVVTLTVLDRTVVGQARFELDTYNIHGTVSADGAFGATIGFQHLTGTFIEDMFEGTFRSFDCIWKMALKHTK